MEATIHTNDTRETNLIFYFLTVNSSAVKVTSINKNKVQADVSKGYYTIVLYSLLFTLRVLLSAYMFLVKKQLKGINKHLKIASYKDVKKMYNSSTGVANALAPVSESLEKYKAKSLISKTYLKVQKTLALSQELRAKCASVLFVNANNENPYQKKDSETFKSLEDFWGDDSDEVYAKNTHSALVKKL